MERTSTAIKVFVGNLSFFSGREELDRFFSPCGTIENIHLCKSETGDTMHFAFITFTNQDEASTAIKTLNNTLFMGRSICVRTADRTIAKQFASTRKLEGWEVMFSFISHQKDILVCEESLREIFMRFGEVLDCVIRSYNIGDNATQASRGLQNGYGFVEFRDRDTAEYVVTNIKSGSFLPFSPPSKPNKSPSSEEEDCDSGPFTVNLDCSLSRRSVSKIEELKNQDSNKSSLSHMVKSKSLPPTETSAPQVQVSLDSSNGANQGKSSIPLQQVFNPMAQSVAHSVPSLSAPPTHVQTSYSFPGNNQSISYGPNSTTIVTPSSYSSPFMQHNASLHQSSQEHIQMPPYAWSTQLPLFYTQTNASVSSSDISHSNTHMNVYSSGQGNNSNNNNNNAANSINNHTIATQDSMDMPTYLYPSQSSVVVPLFAGQSLVENTTQSDGSTSFVSDGSSCSNGTFPTHHAQEQQISPHLPIYYPPQGPTGFYSSPYFYAQQQSTQFMPQQLHHHHQQQQQQRSPVQQVIIPTPQQSMTMIVQPHASGNLQYFSLPVDYHQQPYLNLPHQQHQHIAPQHTQQYHRLTSPSLQSHSQQQSSSPQHHGEFFHRSSSSSQSPSSRSSHAHSLSQHGTFFRG